jgi:hypothetical protein
MAPEDQTPLLSEKRVLEASEKQEVGGLEQTRYQALLTAI